MNSEEALALAEEAVLAKKRKNLNSLQRLILKASLEGNKFEEISNIEGYSPSHIKNVGAELWKLLSEALNETVSKSNVRAALERRWQSRGSTFETVDESKGSIAGSHSTPHTSQSILGSAIELDDFTRERWQQCTPPTEWIRALVVDPHNSNFLYAGTDGNGVYKSTDAGQSWKAINNGLPNLDVYTLAISYHDDKIYVGTACGLFVSLNQGDSWQTQHERFLDLEVRCLALSPQDSDMFICGTGEHSSGVIFSVGVGILGSEKISDRNEAASTGDLHISTEQGISWMTTPIQNVNAAVISPQDCTVIYLGTSDDGVFRSLDGGERWQQVSKLNARNIFSLAVSPQNCYQVFAGTNRGLHMSLDGGDSWQMITEVGSDQVSSVAFSLLNSNCIYAGTKAGIFESRDGGASWQVVNKGLVHMWVMSIATSSDGTIYAGTSGGGVYKKKSNQSTWQSSNSGFTRKFSSLSLAVQDDNLIYAGTAAGIFRSQNGGKSWKQVGYFRATTPGSKIEPVLSLALTAQRSTEPARQTNFAGLHISTDAGKTYQSIFTTHAAPMYAGTINGHIYKSTDRGFSWQMVGNLDGDRVWSLAISPQKPNIIYAGIIGGGIFKSTDAGSSWSPVNDGLNDLQIICVVISSNNSYILYVGTANGLYKSTDGGSSWQACSIGLPNLPILSIVHSQKTSNLLYIATQGGGVYKSTDEGMSWYAINNGLVNLQVQALMLSPQNDNWLYAGTADGVYKSIDGGEYWQVFNEGFGQKQFVNQLVVSPQNTNLLYTAMKEGIFKRLDVTNN